MNTAISSGLAGFSIGGSQSKLFNNTAASNATEGLLVGATGNLVKGNRAYANASEGIHITGSGDTITKNVALGNGTVDLQDNNATCDSNTWTHDIFGSASPSVCIH
jgi:parallel beta-helix repeat protein